MLRADRDLSACAECHTTAKAHWKHSSFGPLPCCTRGPLNSALHNHLSVVGRRPSPDSCRGRLSSQGTAVLVPSDWWVWARKRRNEPAPSGKLDSSRNTRTGTLATSSGGQDEQDRQGRGSKAPPGKTVLTHVGVLPYSNVFIHLLEDNWDDFSWRRFVSL